MEQSLIMDRVLAFSRHYVRDIVYAANDGVVTTFAVVAGVSGAELSPLIVLALGFANLTADGLSMAVGAYLGIKSERAAELHHEYEEWPETCHAAKHGLVTWLVFISAGMIPLLSFLMPIHRHDAFRISTVLTAIALFGIGALRTLVTHRCWLRSGLEMLAVGAAAATLAFLTGWGIAAIAGQ